MQYNGKTIVDVVEDWCCRIRARALSTPGYIPEEGANRGPTTEVDYGKAEDMLSDEFSEMV